MEPPAERIGAPPRRGLGFWSLLGAGLLVGLANLAKPVHVDDELYVSIARWIAQHPLDPYGGTINWQHIPEPAYKVSISPPLLSYVFAIVIALAGENVALLHLTMVPWLLLACWALYRLAERWVEAPAAPALLVVLGPAVAAGTNLMLDVPLLACVAAAIECMLRGIERRAAAWYLAAGSIGAMGVLIKFPALALVPVFLAAAVQRRRVGPALAVAGPVAALIAWQAVSRWLYGAGQVQAGLSFLNQFQAAFVRQVAERTLTMCAILAWTFPVWVLAPARLSWRGKLGIGFVAALATAAAAALLPASSWRRPWVDVGFLMGVDLGSFALAASVVPGCGPVLKSTALEVDPRPLLWAWIVGVAAIVIPFGPFVAVRSFLPIQPPLALLLMHGCRCARVRLGFAIGLTALLGVALAAVDYRWAACYPAAAGEIAAEHASSGRPIVFLGHWGWQYYAERAGFQAWDARWREPPAGAIVVIPLRADRQRLDPEAGRQFLLVRRITVGPAPLGLTTWNRGAGLRFYGGDYGELPWGFSPLPTEEFLVGDMGPPPGGLR